MAKICGWPEDTVKQLRDLSERLVHGVPEAGVEVAATHVRGLGRGRVTGRKTVKGYWNSKRRRKAK